MNYIIRLWHNTTSNKHLLPLSLLSATALAIWLGGPALSTATHIPLAQPEKRLYAIAILFFAWILKTQLGTKKTPTTAKPTTTASPELTKKLELLEGRLLGALQFLKKTIINKHGIETSLDHLPWYLIIGPSGSGKTSLLAQSNINFILTKQFKQTPDNAPPTSETCDWWITRDSVLVDIPGTFLNSRPKKIANGIPTNNFTGSFLWNSLLGLIKKHRGTQSLNGVILTVSLSDLMTQTNQHKERMIYDLKHRISELKKEFGDTIPFYLTITKCDLLPGFLDFFGDSSGEDINQAWGINIPRLKANEKLADVFAARFNALIKRLNKQLIWRLHQERNPLTRPAIKDFPLQIERLKETLFALLKMLSTTQPFALEGVYLTSAAQQATEDTNNTNLTHTISNTGSQALQILRNPVQASRSYFVRQLLLQNILSHADHHAALTPIRFKRRPKMIALIVGVVLLSAVLLGNDMRHSLKQTLAIRNSLTLYQLQTSQQGSNINNALPLLNALQQSASSSRYSILLYSDNAQQSAITAYRLALQTIVLPEIKRNLEAYLQDSNNQDGRMALTVLKAYLMLGDKQHIQPKFIVDTLEKIAPTLMNQGDASHILKHINAALNTAWQPMSLDSEVINHARKILTDLPPLDLSYLILKDLPSNKEIITFDFTNGKESALLLINPDKNSLSSLYTAASFKLNYDTQIEYVANELTQYNWVLGEPTSTMPSNTVLADQLRSRYIADYIATWEHLLANISLKTPTNLAQTDAIIANLVANNSPLLQLLSLIKQNTAFDPILSDSTNLAAINNLLDNTKEDNELNQINTALRHVHTYLQSILSTRNIHEAAFKSVSLHLENPNDALSQLTELAKQSPEPIKLWLSSLAMHSAQFILQNALAHIENHWQNDVMLTYHEKLAPRFPFTSSAKQDVDLNDLRTFLNSEGTLATYAKTYLKAFVDTSDKKWQWKKMDGTKLPFSDAALEQLQHFAELQQLFFTGNNDAQLLMKFTLQPNSLDKLTKSIKFNINGQALEYSKSAPPIAEALIWPSTNSTHETKISVVTQEGQPITMIGKGDWAWFRIVNKSITKVISPKELALNFDLNGHHVKYSLFVPGQFNPFVLENWEDIKLPGQLTEKI